MPPQSKLPPEVATVLAEVISPLGTQLAARALDADDLAALVICAGATIALPRSLALHTTGEGHRCAFLPLATVAAICDREVRDLTATLREPVRPGELWCLLFWRDLAGRERVLTVPISPLAVAKGPRGRA